MILWEFAQMWAETNAVNEKEEGAKQFKSTLLFKSFQTLELTRLMRQDPNEIKLIAILNAITSFTDTFWLP